LSFEHINQLIIDKKWQSIAFQIESSLHDQNVDEETLIEHFEKIPTEFRNEHCFQINKQLWKHALKIGKIKLAKNYAQSAIDHLIKLKRFPYLEKFLEELKNEGLSKVKINPCEISLMKGNCSLEKINIGENWDKLHMHPEKWKSDKDFLQQFLLSEDDWEIEHWKLVYEFILNFHFDQGILLNLLTRAEELNKHTHASKISSFLTSKKIKIHSKKPAIESKSIEKKFTENLKVNYDDLALEIISSGQQLTHEEQHKVLLTMRDLSAKELKAKGKEMIVAFGLLGMEEVVGYLHEKVIPLLDDVRTRASISFVYVQSLFEKESYHKMIDVIDEVIANEPLLNDEIIAFEYLKAEALLKTNRKKLAQELFSRIKKQNPHYRLVGQRLKESEAF